MLVQIQKDNKLRADFERSLRLIFVYISHFISSPSSVLKTYCSNRNKYGRMTSDWMENQMFHVWMNELVNPILWRFFQFFMTAGCELYIAHISMSSIAIMALTMPWLSYIPWYTELECKCTFLVWEFVHDWASRCKH